MLQLLFGRQWRASRALLLNRDQTSTLSQRVQYEAIVRLVQIKDTDLLYLNIRRAFLFHLSNSNPLHAGSSAKVPPSLRLSKRAQRIACKNEAVG